MKSKSPKILVVGIGQTLRSDDGVGIKSVQAWKEANTDFIADNSIEVWLRTEFSIEDLQSAAVCDHLILVDAMISGTETGSVHVFTPSDLSPTSTAGQSAHGWSLVENLELAKTLSLPIPSSIILIGIEAQTFAMGDSLSPKVESNLPEIISIIQKKTAALF